MVARGDRSALLCPGRDPACSLEGRPIETNPARLLHQIRTILSRYRRWILVAAGLGLVVAGALLYRAQERSKQYTQAFQKGMSLWNKGEAERALVEFRKAAGIDPRDPELWVMIGRSEGVSGHLDRAPDAWEEALRQEPGYRPALFERGKEALGRHVVRRVPPPVDPTAGWLPLRLEPASGLGGGAEEAKRILADLEDAALQDPAYARFARGATCLLEGRYPEAYAHLQKYADPNRWDTTALELLGIAGHFGALPDRAEGVLSEAISRRSEKALLQVRAQARYLQGNYEGAREDFREAGLEKEVEPLFSRRIPASGLILWLRADAGVELSGSSISKWVDQSTAHHDAAPKDPAAGPQVSASALHGRPAVLFSGNADELRLPDGFEDFSAGLSVFAVAEPMMEPSEGWSWVFLATPARGAARVEMLLGRRRDSEQIVYAAEDLKHQPRPYIEGIVPAREFELFGAIHEPSGTARLYKQGTLAASGRLLLPQKTLRTRNRVGEGFKGRIAEIVLYNRNLSEVERLGVQAYIKERYFSDGPSTPKR